MAGQYTYLTTAERRELHDLAVAGARALNAAGDDGNKLMALLRRSLADVQHGRDVAASLRRDLREARRQRDNANNDMSVAAARIVDLVEHCKGLEARVGELSAGCGQLSGAVHANRRRAEAAEAGVAAARAFADEMATYCSPHGVAAVYADRLRERLDSAAAR